MKHTDEVRRNSSFVDRNTDELFASFAVQMKELIPDCLIKYESSDKWVENKLKQMLMPENDRED